MFSLGGKEWVFRVSIRGFLLGRKSVLSHEGGDFLCLEKFCLFGKSMRNFFWMETTFLGRNFVV